ncbi:RNA polymerase sigma factor [Deinococcus maricopensis]|uniref:RNA polymerase, sigma-24 subunit, ECF subfamily n=1 Tax=Deinococcus maricopensis (strain DSM 21211 / LMG 22137 / NRRL B-23946 / LB-34) TaxID=709986 RepID=E8U5N1_DEIML|nr:sigma-70 family RNA polymerase sigma factor [Deinococcus maricopensis]ADV66370.1 RNA polymerase, sigma-24 subunit, ECF subfamily [Deinococcus maricopensis DSM 21211]
MGVTVEHLTDTELIARARAPFSRGREAAFETLVRRHAPRVHALARSLVGVGAADDVVQEVFVSVHRHLGAFRGDAAFGTWLHRVTLNACYAALRVRPSVPFSEVPEPVSGSDPVREGERADLRARLTWALAQLPREQREAVALRELSGLTYEEVAEVMGVELGTVKSRINRGRVALRALLSAQGVRPE